MGRDVRVDYGLGNQGHGNVARRDSGKSRLSLFSFLNVVVSCVSSLMLYFNVFFQHSWEDHYFLRGSLFSFTRQKTFHSFDGWCFRRRGSLRPRIFYVFCCPCLGFSPFVCEPFLLAIFLAALAMSCPVDSSHASTQSTRRGRALPYRWPNKHAINESPPSPPPR